MLSILGRTHRLPKDLINVDFASAWVHEDIAKKHRESVFPMVTKEVQIMNKGFGFKNIFDRYAFGA